MFALFLAQAGRGKEWYSSTQGAHGDITVSHPRCSTYRNGSNGLQDLVRKLQLRSDGNKSYFIVVSVYEELKKTVISMYRKLNPLLHSSDNKRIN